jgi:hypothetical protein
LTLRGPGTVGVSLAESADAAISMLLRQIAAEEDGLPQQARTSLKLEPFLILRQSTAPPPGGWTHPAV